jgi:hypothetical protein
MSARKKLYALNPLVRRCRYRELFAPLPYPDLLLTICLSGAMDGLLETQLKKVCGRR